MAVVLMEGFDHISVASITTKGWSFASGNMVAGRFGGQALRGINAGTSYITKALPSTYSELIVGFAYQLEAFTAREVFVTRNGGTIVAKVTVVLVGANYVFRVVNAAGTTLATGTTPIVLANWYYLEVKVVVSATVGTVELRLNGASTAECSGTGLNTGALNIDNIGYVFGSLWIHSWDDIYAVDTSGSAPTNTWLGDVKVETLYPTANGTNTAWTGAYTDVDDPATFDSDATFISSSTPGDKETYAVTDLTTAAGTVLAVQTNLVARKDDAGVRTIAPVLRTGGTDYDGTTTPELSASYVDYTQLYDRLDPSGAAWSISTVNAMEAGVKEVA